MSLTSKVSNIEKRVEALETKNISQTASIARIVKMYGNIRVTATITTKIHDHIMPGVFYAGTMRP